MISYSFIGYCFANDKSTAVIASIKIVVFIIWLI